MKKIPLGSNNYSFSHNCNKMQKSKIKLNRSLIGISLVTVFLLSFGLAEDAFAISAGSEFTPTQPNANVSFDNATKQIQVEWDFTTGGVDAPETCLLKGDLNYYENLNDNWSSGVSGVDYDRVRGFIPLYYSVVTATPVPLVLGGGAAEEVPCTGDIRIDLDTVMSHSQNINNYKDLELFLSFYVANADGSLNLANDARIDEVFVMYTPNHVFDDGAYRAYGCNGQIGSTLYVDASGSNGSLIAHGDNGDNCGDHLYLENNEYVDIGPEGSSSPGVPAYDNHIASSYSLFTLVFYPESEYKGSSCGDCIPPTFGMDENNFLIVTNGFSYNTVGVDVSDYHTDYPLITAVTNQTNTVLLKVYENNGLDNISVVQFGLGMPKVGSPLQHAQTLVEVWLDKTEVKNIIKTDENNLVDIQKVTTSIVDCGGTEKECLAVEMQYIYRDQPKFNIMAINAIDYGKNTWNNYMNDGIEVTGDSLNEPLTQKVTVSKAGVFYPQKAGATTLTLSDYKTDTWIDEYGYIWSTNEHGPYLVDIISPPEKTPDEISPWSGYNHRGHSEFGEYVKIQQEKAVLILYEMDKQERNGEIYVPTIPDSVIIHDTINRDDLNFSESLIEQAKIIVVEYKKQYEPVIYKEYEKHIITQTIKEILAMERADDYVNEIKSKVTVDVKLLNNILTISGNIGYADTSIPVVLISLDDYVVYKKPIKVSNDGSFNIGYLKNDHTDFVLSHDGEILKEFEYGSIT